ncbi:MAG: flavin reductase family protein [Chloroflexi bacterium]|nr:flavin reductase family protein [Chloroflexota bacterium]
MSAIGADLFKDIMRHWAAGVTVVTTRVGLAVHGCTANSFASVSATPPLVCISLAKSSHTYTLISQSRIFAVNILGESQQDLSMRFASSALSAQQRFADEPYHNEATGAPVFDRAIAYADCRIHAEFDVELNSILVGLVVAGRAHAGEPPLIYSDRRYWRMQP